MKPSRQAIAEYRASRKRDKAKDDEHRKSERRRHYLAQYREWLWPYRWPLAGVMAMALVATGLEMVLPLASRHIIDGILLAPDLSDADRRSRLHLVGGATLGVLVVYQIIETVRSYRTTVLNSRVLVVLRRRLYERLVRLSLSDIAELKTGGIVSRLSSDVDSVTGLVQMAVISPGVALTRVVVTLSILIYLNATLALVAAAMLLPLTWISVLWVQRARPIYRSMSDDRTGVDGRVAETFGGVRVVRSFRREATEQHDYVARQHLHVRKKLLAEIVEMIVNGGWSLVVPLISLVITWLGGLLFLGGQLSIGDIVAFQLYSGMLLFPVWRIVMSLSQTQRALASMEKVFEIMEKPRDLPDRPGAVLAPRKVGEIVVDGVGFEYKPGVPVLRDVSFRVPGGAVVALVGPSGAGKTTLTDLVARFHDPTTGRILLDGVDLRELRLDSFRSLLGVVQQEVFLFDGTIRENIAYGRRDATAAEVEAAARRANAHDFIAELAGGYDAVIGERGVKLSGGQRQRLSLARALLADPQILILDEATSNLDTESEQLIQKALRELFKDRTTFVIAHRLSTITHADIILVMEHGRVVESGSHETLMRARGAYHAMVERQRQAFVL